MPANNVIPIRQPARRLIRRARAARRDDLRKSTVRFLAGGAGGHGVVPLARQGTPGGDRLLIGDARATAAHYRKLAEQADKAVMQARMLGLAAQWDKRAAALEKQSAARQGRANPEV